MSAFVWLDTHRDPGATARGACAWLFAALALAASGAALRRPPTASTR